MRKTLGLLLVCVGTFASSINTDTSLIDEGVSSTLQESEKMVLGRKWSDLIALQEAEIQKARSTDYPMMAYLGDSQPSSFLEVKNDPTELSEGALRVQAAQTQLNAASGNLATGMEQAAAVASSGVNNGGWDATFQQLQQQLPQAAATFGPMSEVGLRAASEVANLGQGSQTGTMGALALGGLNGMGMSQSSTYFRTCPNFAQDTPMAAGPVSMTNSDKIFMGQGLGADFTIRANANLKVAYVTFPAVHDVKSYTADAEPVMVDMEGCLGGKAHEGFWNLASINYRNIKLREALLSFVKKGYSINFDGHGVGGAIALLFVWLIAADPSLGLSVDDLKVITYGAPNILNQQGADCYAAFQVTGKIMRWNIDGDPVPLIPEGLTSVGYVSRLPAACEFMDKMNCHKNADYLNSMFGLKSFSEANPSTKDNQCFSSMGGMGAMNRGSTNNMIATTGVANTMGMMNGGAGMMMNGGTNNLRSMAVTNALAGSAAMGVMGGTNPLNKVVMAGAQNGMHTQNSVATANAQAGNVFLGHSIRDLNGGLAQATAAIDSKIASMPAGSDTKLNKVFEQKMAEANGGTGSVVAPTTAPLPPQTLAQAASGTALVGASFTGAAGAGAGAGRVGGVGGGLVAGASVGGGAIAGMANMQRIKSNVGMSAALNQAGALGGVGLGMNNKRVNNLMADVDTSMNDPGQERLNFKIKEKQTERLTALGFGPQIIPEKPALCKEEAHKSKGYCNFQRCNLKCDQFPHEEFCANCRQIWVPRGGPKGFNEELEKTGHHVPIALQSTAHIVANAPGDDGDWQFPNLVNDGIDPDMDFVLLQKKKRSQKSLSPHTTQKTTTTSRS